MLTINDRFAFELRKLVTKRIEHLKEELSVGALEDLSAYKKICGEIEGLRSIDQLIDDAEAICNGREG